MYQYDPATHGVTKLPVTGLAADPKGLTTLSGKRLLIASGAPAKLSVYDVARGTTTQVLPAAYQNYSFAYNVATVGDDVYVEMVTPQPNRILHFSAKDMSFLGEVPAATDVNWNTGIVPAGPHSIFISGTTYDASTSTYGDTSYYEQQLPKPHGQTPSPTPRVQGDWVGKDVWPVKIGHRTWLASIGSNGLFGRWNPDTGQLVLQQLNLPGLAHRHHRAADRTERPHLRRDVRDELALRLQSE